MPADRRSERTRAPRVPASAAGAALSSEVTSEWLHARPSPELVEGDRTSCRHVQRLGVAGRGNRRLVTLCHEGFGQPIAFRAEEERERRLELHVGEGLAPARDEGEATLRKLAPAHDRHPEDRACRRSHRAWAGGVGAALGQCESGSERVGRTEERADVAGVGDPPQADDHLAAAGRQVAAAVDADHARCVPERRDLGEELGNDVLAGDEEFDRLDPGGRRGLDQILALDREEARLLALLARGEKLPDEPELLVSARLDQAASASGPSAAFARSATAANACGSLTAMSASDLRSSSIPAFFTPAMKRL